MVALWAVWWVITMAIETIITAVMAIMVVDPLTGRLTDIKDMVIATITVATVAKP